MNSWPLLVSLPLLGLGACGGFSLVTLEADPPARILSLGKETIDETTPYTFRPDDYVPERNQDLRLVLQTSKNAPTGSQPEEYRWRLWYGYGGALDQVQTPKLTPSGDLWFHRGRDRVLFVRSSRGDALLVENAWAHRMDLASRAMEQSGDPKPAQVSKPAAPPIRYRRQAPGPVDLETRHWKIQGELPPGITLLYEEGAGQGKFVHVAHARSLTGKVHARREGQDDDSTPVATQFLSMSRILERNSFSEIYFAYVPGELLHVRADLEEGRTLVLHCRSRSTEGTRPPLILCICPGR